MKVALEIFNYSITNAGNSSADINIDGDIVDAQSQQILKDWFGDETSVSFRSFRDQVNALDVRELNIYVNSYGGHVGDAMAIHDHLQELQNKGIVVNTIGRGIIASAATYIVMAGRKPQLTKNSMFLIHPVSGGIYGNVNEMQNYLNGMIKFNNLARDFYANKTGMRAEEITKLMNAETWMNAEEAQSKGFVKALLPEANFKNSISPDKWHFNNKAVLNSYNNSVKPEGEAITLQDLKNEITDMKKSFLQNFLDTLKGDKKPEELTNVVVNLADLQAAITALPEDEPAEPADNSAAITLAVTNAAAGFETRIKTLEATNKTVNDRNEKLVNQLSGMIGKPIAENNGEEGSKKLVGSFGNKAVTKGI